MFAVRTRVLWHDRVQRLQQLPAEGPEDIFKAKKEAVIDKTIKDFIDRMTDQCSHWKQKILGTTTWFMRFNTYCRHLYLRHNEQCDKSYLSLTIQTVIKFNLFRIQQSSFFCEKSKSKKQDNVQKLIHSNPSSLPQNPKLQFGLQ